MTCKTCEHKGSCDHQCMMLPDGVTCASCAHLERCVLMFKAKASDTRCKFVPIRYKKQEESA